MINLYVDKTTNDPNRRNETKENQKKELDKNAEMCFKKFFEKEVKKLLTKKLNVIEECGNALFSLRGALTYGARRIFIIPHYSHFCQVKNALKN